MKHTYKTLLLGLTLLTSAGVSAQTTFSYTGALQTYTVPAGVSSIEIEVHGAQGGDAANGGGLGAIMIGTFAVTPGQVLDLLVGGQGVINVSSSNGGGSGGGGSFVVDQATVTAMIVAGGGGGGCDGTSFESSYSQPYNATITDAQLGTSGATTTGGAGGGTAGNGGGAGFTDCCLTGNIGGSGGGGFLTDGTNGSTGVWGYPSNGGKAFVNGGAGGINGSADSFYPIPTGSGGFGGGGGSAMDNAFRAGGGGGYSGGQGAAYVNTATGYIWGGGGGSLNTGTAQTNSIGHTGDGEITITELCMGLVTSVSATDVCEGETVTLSASSTGTGTVTWDGGVVDGVPFTPPVGTTTYTATSDDPADCGFSVDITVNALPIVDAGTDVDACEGETVTLTGGGADTYVWDGGVTDGVPFTPAGGTTTFTVTGTVTATGCENTDVVDVNYTMVDEGVTVTGGTLSSDQAGATYQWIDCSTSAAMPGETNQDFTPTQNGDYAVIVTINGCSDTSACENIGGIGFNEQASAVWKLYPNPANTGFTIAGKGMFDFVIVNLGGQKILAGKKSSGEKIDVSMIAPGVYFVQVTGEFATSVHKVIIQ